MENIISFLGAPDYKNSTKNKQIYFCFRSSLLIISSIVFSLFLMACGKKTETQASTELLWYGIGPVQKDYDLVFAKVNEVLAEKNQNYTVKYDSFNWGDYGKKMALILNSGERADIIFTASWAAGYYNNAVSGYFTALDELLAQTPVLKKSLPDKFWDAVRVSGTIYGVPTYKDMVYQDYAAMQKSVLDKLPLDISSVTDIASLTPFLAAAKAADPDRIAYIGEGFPIIRGDYPFGYNVPVVLVFAEQEKGFQVVPDSQEFIAQMKIIRDWYEKGYIPSEVVAIKEGEGYKNPSNKNWFLRNYQGYPGAETSQVKTWGVKLEVAPINAPPVLSRTTPMGSILSIPSSSTHADSAMSFIELLNTDKTIRNMVGFGLEGVHYEKIGDNRIRLLDKSKDYTMPNFALGSLLPLYLLEGERSDAREALQKFNEEAEASPILGLVLDPEKYRAQNAAAGAIWSEFASIATGTLPVEETLKKFREKLRETGWYDAVAQMNKEYQEWLSKQ